MSYPLPLAYCPVHPMRIRLIVATGTLGLPFLVCPIGLFTLHISPGPFLIHLPRCASPSRVTPQGRAIFSMIEPLGIELRWETVDIDWVVVRIRTAY